MDTIHFNHYERKSMTTTRLFGTGTATPPHTAPQDHSRWFMNQIIDARQSGHDRQRSQMFVEAIFEGCGIDRRYSVIEDFTRTKPAQFSFFPTNWSLTPPPTTRQRMEVYERESIDLAEEACRAGLDDARIAPEQITDVVLVTCTGSSAPGTDISLVRRLGLRPTVRRTVIGFMGCYGAFNGLRTADQIVASDPDAVVLVVCVELCSLHFQADLEPRTIIANCLFGDGAGALVLARSDRAAGGHCDVASSRSVVAGSTLDKMRWEIGDHGFLMHLDPDIPSILLETAGPFIDDLLDSSGLERSDVGGWLVHPGGPRIVDAIRDAADLSDEDVAVSRRVLRRVGNLSSATIIFVLQEHLRRRRDRGPMVLLGFGPGLTMEGRVLR